MPLAADGYVVGMVPIIRFTMRQLESADPRDRLSAARSLAELVRQLRADAMPALLASVDAAAADPPAGQEVVLHHVLHEAWRAAVGGSGEAAHAWYAHLVERLERGDPATVERLLGVITDDPTASVYRGGSAYAPLLRAHAGRLTTLLRRLAADRRPDARVTGLVTMIRQQAAADDPVRVELAGLAPVLMPVDRRTYLSDWVGLLVADHPTPASGLAALLDAAIGTEHATWIDVRELLLRRNDVDLAELAGHLRRHVPRWTDAQLDRFVRDTLLDRTAGEPGLALVLRRAPARRAVPRALVEQGRRTPAMTELAEALTAASSAPGQHTPAGTPSGGGVVFVDRNLRLAVIEELMYSLEVLTPRFDLASFVRMWPGREIVPDEEPGPIPEVLDHFAAVALTPEMLARVTSLSVEAGDYIWHEIDPTWAGQDDRFAPLTYADIAHLPKLRKILIGMSTPDTDMSALHERGIEIETM